MTAVDFNDDALLGLRNIADMCEIHPSTERRWRLVHRAGGGIDASVSNDTIGERLAESMAYWRGHAAGSDQADMRPGPTERDVYDAYRAGADR